MEGQRAFRGESQFPVVRAFGLLDRAFDGFQDMRRKGPARRPLRREEVLQAAREAHYLEKSTFGGFATAFSSSTVNCGFSLNPNIIAVRLLGKERTVTLYCCTALMKRWRATAMRFSVPSSCACSSRKFLSDLSCG